MKNSLMLTAIASALILAGCGDAETNIVELDPIEVPDEDDHSDDGHDHGDYEIESGGRLVVTDTASNTLTVIELDDISILDTFTSTFEGSSISASAGYRYAVISSRANGITEFLDGGLWREDHVDHLHDYKEAPALSDFSLEGSKPTHIVAHDGQLAVFYDGDAETSMPAGVKVVTDLQIASEIDDVPSLDFTVNMHGVAEPRGDMLISSVRRDDTVSVSSNPILPDSVAVFHYHDGEYEEEQRFDGECADLHGAAQNELAVAFGCGNGVLVLNEDDEVFTSAFVENIDSLNGLRIGTLYGHEHADTFIGVASQHGSGSAILANVSPVTNSMEVIDWKPEADAHAVSYGFTHEGEYFAILDDKGYVTLLEAHAEGGDTHWEFAHKIDVASANAGSLTDEQSFSMTVSQVEDMLFVVDPVAQAIWAVDLEDESATTLLSLDFVPSGAVWLGIAEAHDH